MRERESPQYTAKMNFPERVFAIGGAGKSIALELLESDWVVEEVLQPRPAPASMTVTIIDTAEGEQNTDKQRIAEIREAISERERELRDSEQGRTGTITVEYKLITDDLHLSGMIDLLGEEAVPRITAGNGMAEDDWWLEQQHINENLDFAKGVVRKRGLGKALYYKAYAEDDEISSYIDLPQQGQVAMLVGLGGGTGSGIMIDLARHLQRKQRTAEITLFGILPNHTEGRRESTNAYAALSELEYNALRGEQLFKDRVVIPIDPTNFDGKTSNRIQTDKLLQELDEAVLYLLISYYNTEGLEDPFADTPRYAPFTVGIPQVLRYNVEAISDARSQFRELLQTKEQALQQEAAIYTRVEQFLSEHYSPDGGTETEFSLRDVDRTDLTERLNGIESWLEFDLFTELEYRSVELVGDLIEEGQTGGGSITEQLDIIAGSLRAVDMTEQGAGGFVDTIDENLAEVLEQNLRLLERRRRILERRQAVDDSPIRDSIEYLINLGDANTSPGVKLQRLEQQLSELTDEHEQTAAERSDVTERLEQRREEQVAAVTEQASAWIRAVEPEVEQLGQLNLDAIEGALTNLDRALDQFVYSVVNTVSHEEVDQIPTDDVLEATDQLSRLLESTAVDISASVRSVSSGLSQLKKAKKAFITMHREKTAVERIKPWKSSTDREHNEARRDYRVQKNNLHDGGVFQIGPPEEEFTVTITHDGAAILRECRQQQTALSESVLDRLDDYLDEVPRETRRSLKTELESETPSVERLRETVEEALEQETGELSELVAEREQLESALADVEQQRNAYSAIVELFQQTNNRLEMWLENSRRFQEQLARIQGTEQEMSTTDGDYVYVKNIQPEDIFRATGRDDISSSDLFNSTEERQRVQSSLEELARNAQNQQYTGLYRRKIARDRSRYSGLKVRLAAMSPAIDQLDPGTLDFQQMFQEAFDLGASGKRVESPFASWRQQTGGPWDIALSVFVTGVFLDNIRKVVQADGYRAGYRERADKLGDDIFIHHGHGLEQSQYVRRTDHLNLEGAGDTQFYLREEEPIVEELLTGYIQREEI